MSASCACGFAGERRPGLNPAAARLNTISSRITADATIVHREQNGALDSPLIRRRGRRGGVGRPTPLSPHLPPAPNVNPLARRSPPARNGSGPRLSPPLKMRMPGGVGQPAPPSSRFNIVGVARPCCGRGKCERIRHVCVVAGDTDLPATARGRGWAVGASLITRGACVWVQS